VFYALFGDNCLKAVSHVKPYIPVLIGNCCVSIHYNRQLSTFNVRYIKDTFITTRVIKTIMKKIDSNLGEYLRNKWLLNLNKHWMEKRVLNSNANIDSFGSIAHWISKGEKINV